MIRQTMGLLLLFTAVTGESPDPPEGCDLSVIRTKMKRKATFIRVSNVKLINASIPKMVDEMRDCVRWCDDVPCPAYAYYYKSGYCSIAAGYVEHGPNMITYDSVKADKELGIYIAHQGIRTLPQCLQQRSEYDQILQDIVFPWLFPGAASSQMTPALPLASSTSTSSGSSPTTSSSSSSSSTATSSGAATTTASSTSTTTSASETSSSSTTSSTATTTTAGTPTTSAIQKPSPTTPWVYGADDCSIVVNGTTHDMDDGDERKFDEKEVVSVKDEVSGAIRDVPKMTRISPTLTLAVTMPHCRLNVTTTDGESHIITSPLSVESGYEDRTTVKNVLSARCLCGPDEDEHRKTTTESQHASSTKDVEDEEQTSGPIDNQLETATGAEHASQTKEGDAGELTSGPLYTHEPTTVAELASQTKKGEDAENTEGLVGFVMVKDKRYNVEENGAGAGFNVVNMDKVSEFRDSAEIGNVTITVFPFCSATMQMTGWGIHLPFDNLQKDSSTTFPVNFENNRGFENIWGWCSKK